MRNKRKITRTAALSLFRLPFFFLAPLFAFYLLHSETSESPNFLVPVRFADRRPSGCHRHVVFALID